MASAYALPTQSKQDVALDPKPNPPYIPTNVVCVPPASVGGANVFPGVIGRDATTQGYSPSVIGFRTIKLIRQVGPPAPQSHYQNPRLYAEPNWRQAQELTNSTSQLDQFAACRPTRSYNRKGGGGMRRICVEIPDPCECPPYEQSATYIRPSRGSIIRSNYCRTKYPRGLGVKPSNNCFGHDTYPSRSRQRNTARSRPGTYYPPGDGQMKGQVPNYRSPKAQRAQVGNAGTADNVDQDQAELLKGAAVAVKETRNIAVNTEEPEKEPETAQGLPGNGTPAFDPLTGFPYPNPMTPTAQSPNMPMAYGYPSPYPCWPDLYTASMLGMMGMYSHQDNANCLAQQLCMMNNNQQRDPIDSLAKLQAHCDCIKKCEEELRKKDTATDPKPDDASTTTREAIKTPEPGPSTPKKKAASPRKKKKGKGKKKKKGKSKKRK